MCTLPTGEDDEVGVLVAEDAVEEGGGVEVGAPGHLGREHVLAARGPAVGVVHVRHLHHLERPAAAPEPHPGAGTAVRPPPPRLSLGGTGRRGGEDQDQEQRQRAVRAAPPEAEAAAHAGAAVRRWRLGSDAVGLRLLRLCEEEGGTGWWLARAGGRWIVYRKGVWTLPIGDIFLIAGAFLAGSARPSPHAEIGADGTSTPGPGADRLVLAPRRRRGPYRRHVRYARYELNDWIGRLS